MKRRPMPTVPCTIDAKLMQFIWRWKIATTAALTARFYPDFKLSPKTTYWRLSRLRQRGLVTIVEARFAREYVWTLTNAGFKAIESRLEALKERGFASENVYHDLLVSAAHLGDYLPRYSAPTCETVTEQELRRLDPSCYPEWVPKSELHRPDGYWNMQWGNRRAVIALEMEISAKTNDHYNQTTAFYNNKLVIDGVVWIVSGETLANRILSQARRGVFPFRNIHQFVLLDDFRNTGWKSTIFLGGNRGQKLCDFLSGNGPSNPSINLPESSGTNWIHTLLDTSLEAVKSRTYIEQGDSKNPLLYGAHTKNKPAPPA